MKKLNMKSILALLLTLCMLLGSVAALAEGEVTAPAEPAAPAPIENTTVTVAAGETAGAVTATISDISNDELNGLSVNRQVIYSVDGDGKETRDEDFILNVNNSGEMITPEAWKLLEDGTALTVNAGNIAENLTKPVEITHPEWNDETGEIVLDENGNEKMVTEKYNYTTGLDVSTYEGLTTEGSLTVNAGNIYAATSAKIDNDDDLNATGVYATSESEKNPVDVNLNSAFAKADAPATVPAEGQKAEDVENTLGASATAVSLNAENGGSVDVELKEGATAVANAKNGSASATAANIYEWIESNTKKAASTATLTVGDLTATATSASSTAYADALWADADGDKNTLNVTAGDLTATATGVYDATARGVGTYNDNNGTTTIKTGDITVTATVTGEDNDKRNTYADATGAHAYGEGGSFTVEVNGNVTATSSKSAIGIDAASKNSRVWDEKEGKDVESKTPSTSNVKVTGNVIVEGGAKAYKYGNTVIAIDAYANTCYDTKTDEKDAKKTTKEFDKVGGETNVTVTGNVLAKGSETAGDLDRTNGINAFAETNAKVNVAVTGNVAATGKGAVGIEAAALKDGKINVLVDGTVSGDGVAIAVEKASSSKDINLKGEKEFENSQEYDPTAPAIYVWAAKENADGRIATVYSEDRTFTEKEVKKIDENGKEYTATEWDSAVTRTVDAEASAKLEAAIWYIAKVADKWQDKITVAGTSTYTANDTTYQVAHQDEDVKLTFQVPHGKKLRAIMYDDGTKAEYVKNEDGTYTVKMKRGGGMLLSLKLKKKEQPKAAATTTTASTATEGEAEATNWAYGVEIENVGTVYYGRDYFAQKDKDIINPLTKEAYTEDEIKAIVDGAKKGAVGYVFDIPEEAWLGMNDFWYDQDAALAIVAHEDELTIGDDGVFTTADGEEVAKPIQK